MKPIHRIRHKLKKWLPVGATLIVLMATLILAEWTARGLSGEILFEHIYPDVENHQALVTSIVVMAFGVAMIILYVLKRYLLQPRGFYEDEVTPHRCLIVPLSAPIRKNDKDVSIIPNNNSGYDITVKNIPVAKEKDIEKDIISLEGSGWSWQQFLRGMAIHQNKLEAVYLIGTAGKPDGTPGSIDSLKVAKFLINNYKENVRVVLHDKAVNPDSFNPLCDAINEGVMKLKELNYDEDDIVIDVTGATKMVSIAGASVTMNKDVLFQYVQTEADKGTKHKVFAYNVIAGRSAPTAE